MVKVTNNQDRSRLSEGRNWGMGFAFCKQIKENEFQTIQPLSACKDYLNDIVYTEATGYGLTVYGLISKKTDCFIDQGGWLAIKILPRFGGHSEGIPHLSKKAFEDNTALLHSNINNILSLINYVESELNVDGFTTISKVENDPDMYLLTVPKWWLRGGALISLYSLIVRMGHTYDGSVLPNDYLKSYDKSGLLDSSLWADGKKRYEYFLKHGPIFVKPEDIAVEERNGKIKPVNAYAIHNGGIISIKLPEVGPTITVPTVPTVPTF